MDSTAIKQIQETSTTKIINDAICNAVGQPALMAPKDFQIVSLERYQTYRDRFRGSMHTKNLLEFSAYAKQFATPGATTFIDADSMSAKHIIDLGDKNNAGHCEHKASIKLEKTAAYKALLSIINDRKSQKEIAEFIEDWRANLTAFYEEDSEGAAQKMSIVKALHAVRKIKIEASSSNESSVQNFGASTSSMDSIDVKSQDTPPAYLNFTCEPYTDLPSRTFILRLSIITERAPALVLRIVQDELHKEQMAIEFQELIKGSIKDITPKVNTFIGTFSE